VLVAVYNAGDFGGRYLPLWKPFYLQSRKGIFLLCLARGLFIPCFYFAAKYADAGWMIFLCIMLGSTNGWLSVLGFMLAPRGYSVRFLCFFFGIWKLAHVTQTVAKRANRLKFNTDEFTIVTALEKHG